MSLQVVTDAEASMRISVHSCSTVTVQLLLKKTVRSVDKLLFVGVDLYIH